MSGSISHRFMHVTVLDASLVIKMADQAKTAHVQNEPEILTDSSFSEILEENEVKHAIPLLKIFHCHKVCFHFVHLFLFSSIQIPRV